RSWQIQEKKNQIVLPDFFFTTSIRFTGPSNLVRRSVLASSGSIFLRTAVVGIEPRSSLPSPAPITTGPTID
ncbi:hypothetical protein A2U01_0032656, partial [Trifolium medium]|nr:hypothetical protein [Trifolium medium]